MRDDLLDAYAAVDWARSQLEPIEKEFKAWYEGSPYLLVEEPHREVRKKFFKLEINRPLPGTLNAWVGAIINSTRTSLDLLAASLAKRNGKAPSADRHFPVYRCLYDFIDPLNVAERKKWLSTVEFQIIEHLKPYRGGNDFLFALHHLDVTRKHVRLIDARLEPSQFVVSPEAYRQGFEFPPMWPGFKDGAIIGWTHIDATNSDFHVAAEITFNEAELASREPIVVVLRQFTGMAEGIIQSFERT